MGRKGRREEAIWMLGKDEVFFSLTSFYFLSQFENIRKDSEEERVETWSIKKLFYGIRNWAMILSVSLLSGS